MQNPFLLQKQYLVGTYINRGITLVRGDGVYLYDRQGNQYLDMTTNYGVNLFGYNHPKITEAVTSQFQKLPTLHCSFNNDKRGSAAKNLIERCSCGLTNVYFANSGTEAVEAALKFAVLATGKHRFISMENGYHGKTIGSLSATSGEKYRDPFKPLIWEFDHVPFGDIKALTKAVKGAASKADNKTAAIILEPVQGEGGINVPDKNYLKSVEKLCRDSGILLIVDEIQTGLGRTGHFLAIENADIRPDILTLGKGLAGGYPVGATLVSKKINAAIPKGIHTSTFGGNPAACAGILETLSLLNEDLLRHVNKMSNYLFESLKRVKSDLIVDVRGAGLMIGIEVKSDRDKILKLLQQNRILTLPSGKNVVRLLPPLIVQKEHIDHFIQIFKDILNHV